MEPASKISQNFFQEEDWSWLQTAGVFLHHSHGHSHSRTALRSELNGPRGRRVPCASWST